MKRIVVFGTGIVAKAYLESFPDIEERNICGELVDTVKFVEYSKNFFDYSKEWLADREIKWLTVTPDIDDETREKWFRELKDRTDYYIWGIAVDKIPVGAVGIKHIDYENKTGEYWGYIGNKEYWGRGIGKKMVEHMCEEAKKLGLDTLSLKVAEYNHRAIHLYSKQGFEMIVNDSGIILMQKEL